MSRLIKIVVSLILLLVILLILQLYLFLRSIDLQGGYDYSGHSQFSNGDPVYEQCANQIELRASVVDYIITEHANEQQVIDYLRGYDTPVASKNQMAHGMSESEYKEWLYLAKHENANVRLMDNMMKDIMDCFTSKRSTT